MSYAALHLTILVKETSQRKKASLTFRNLSRAPLASKVSFPCSSIVTAASLAKVTPEENGLPGLLHGKQFCFEKQTDKKYAITCIER
jgi:hypothetical protein